MTDARATHTPGPLTAHFHGGNADALIEDANGFIIGAAYGVLEHDEDENPLVVGDAGANARLWASAPDLLDALTAIAAQWDQTKYYGPLNNLARAAIAKATGLEGN